MRRYGLFFIRWALCSLGLWISIRLFGEEVNQSVGVSIATFLFAGLIFSFVNSILRPIITILSLPFVIVTLGLFMLIVNGFMVWVTIAIAPNLHMGFGAAIISGIVLSLVNYLVSEINEFANKEA